MQQIRSRLVLNFPGFESTDSIKQLGRLHHVANKSGGAWGFSVEQGEPEPHPDLHHTIAEHASTGGNWDVKTRVVQFRWNDIVTAYEDAPFPFGFLKDTAKYLAFFTDGTVGRYFQTSARYWGFTIYPVLLVAIFLIAAWFVSGWLISWFGLSGIAAVAAQIAGSLAVTLGLCKLFGGYTYLLITIADWGFARDMVNRINPEIETRFAEFTRVVMTEIKASDEDEIIIVGHSFGAIWAIVAIGQAFESQADLLADKRVTFLALGSSILKLALAPNAQFITDYWNLVTAEKNLFWHEVQTKDDLIAFYKCDPFELPQFSAPTGGYKIDRVRFKNGMEKSRYNQMRKSFYTTHRQYILYYDRRVPFDYALRLFGPFSAKALANDSELHTMIDASGKLG